MEIKELVKKPDIDRDRRIKKVYYQFENLLVELGKRELPNEIVSFINNGIEQVNSVSGSIKVWGKQIIKTQASILKLIEKELKIVVRHHYRDYWLAIGMAVFGLPVGLVLGASLGNWGFIGFGIPVGMIIGIALGSQMDKKAFEEGRQLDIEIKN